MKKPDYSKENYCIECDLKFPKDVFRCSKCKQMIRSKPNSNIRNKKYLDKKPRM